MFYVLVVGIAQYDAEKHNLVLFCLLLFGQTIRGTLLYCLCTTQIVHSVRGVTM